VVVFGGPEGTKGTYLDIDRVEIVELLNAGTWHYNIASVETSRDRFVERVKKDIEDFGRADGFNESWSDEQIAEAARKEAAKYDDSWTPAIAIYASWKEL